MERTRVSTSETDKEQYALIRTLTERLAEHEKECAERGARIESRLDALEGIMRRNQHLLIGIVGGLSSGFGVYLIGLLTG